MTRAALLAIVLVFASLALPPSSRSAASDSKPAAPALSCHVGPIRKTYGGTPWLLYSCADAKTLVVVSDTGSPAMPFYFVFVPSEGAYRLSGEGTGAKTATDAAFHDLAKLGSGEISGLIAETQAKGDPGATIVDLLFGQCLSEATHAAPPPGSTDPRLVGQTVGSQVRDPRLSPQAVRVPTASGEVYFDHHAKACEVFATGIDAADVVTKIQNAVTEMGPKAREVAPRPPMEAASPDRTLVYEIGTLGQASVPLLKITYPLARPASLAASIVLYRQINVTSDSAPGWSPTEDQSAQVVSGTNAFLAAMDAGRYAEAYAWLADVNKQQQTLSQFNDATRQFNAEAGRVRERTIVQVTWTKDPAQGPFPGVYAAVDLRSRFENIDRHCGYIVLYQRPSGGGFLVMRREDNFLTNATAESIEKRGSSADVDRAWADLSRNCPNYPAPLPPVPPEAPSSTIGYPNVTAALAGLHAKRGVVFSSNNGWTIAEDEADKTIWSFPSAGDPAYPSAVKRQLVQTNAGVEMNMNILCQSTKEACDNLVRQFQQLNAQARDSLGGK